MTSDPLIHQQLVHNAANRDINDFIQDAVEITAQQLPGIHVDALQMMLMIFRVGEAILYDLEATVQRPAGVSSSGFHLLWVVWLTGSVEASAAASMMGVSRATVSGVSNTLEAAGLIRRVQSASDGRSRLLSLTPEGRSRFEAIFRGTDARYVNWYNCLSAAEAASLSQILGKLGRAMKPTAKQRV